MMFFKRKKKAQVDQNKPPTIPVPGQTGPLNRRVEAEQINELLDEVDEGEGDIRSTMRLHGPQFASMLDLTPAPDSSQVSGTFHPVPKNDPPSPAADTIWKVELKTPINSEKPIRLMILGDVVLGRTEAADVSLDDYGGIKKGVSRRHALLRPTPNQLYIIELGSTNGTLLNGLALGPGMARPLHNEDVITLGDLRLTVRLFGGPTARSNVSMVDMYVPDVLEKRKRPSRSRDKDERSTEEIPPIEE
jgi:hypothetical protein